MSFTKQSLPKNACRWMISLLMLGGSFQSAFTQPATLLNQHTDIGVAYENGILISHIHDESTDTEYAPDEAVLVVGKAAETRVPADSRFAFLGTPGSRVFILPQIQKPDLLFLGLAAEEIETGIFSDNQLRLDLKRFAGPGEFFVYSTGGILGTPVLKYDTSNGLSTEDSATLLAGSHNDLNWAFTQPGDYTLTFQASGKLLNSSEMIKSQESDFHFQVIPEPSSQAFLGLAGALYLWNAVLQRRRP